MNKREIITMTIATLLGVCTMLMLVEVGVTMELPIKILTSLLLALFWLEKIVNVLR